MPFDPHLFEGEGERFRRYDRFLVDPHKRQLVIFDHDSFFQDKKFDTLYGDIHRKFAPLTPTEASNRFLHHLIVENYESFPKSPSVRQEPFEVSVHMIRIQATPGSGLGRPAPEGIHRDGYHFGSIHLMNRDNVIGAMNNIYDLGQNLIDQKGLHTPLDTIVFDDAAIFHAVTPFRQADAAKLATRDMLILLYQPLKESPQPQDSERRVVMNY